MNLHWLFYRLLRNVATDIFGGKPGPNKKTTKKTKILRPMLQSGGGRVGFTGV